MSAEPRVEPTPSTRELHDGLGEEVLAVGAPPVPTATDARWGFHPCAAEGSDVDRDLDLVHGWMNSEHVAQFWEQAWSREKWAGALAGQWAGTYSRPYIVSLDGEPFAYIELYRAARDVIARHYAARPHDVGYHVAIGDRGRTGRGLGGQLFLATIRGVFDAEPDCTRIMSDPEASHVGARRMDERIGLTLLGEYELPHKRTALYVFPRSAADLPSAR
ncbi:GNAT family N-acetyltransferase [Pseudonocardia pini]|uniref:GNAT family N-acetyltransferase n=1 Tax=Pseudonocardia pini TaxID=2758030 RepID=UPI0015F00B06|nr:GNAT family N-acetyltransferase [Pseudonocardia pini]